ncbi:helix-turn-helix domain-containing protein [Thermus brockianus]|uniref:helix-turn-helix domain-containing protein n=1 Tax=Thermus brockianus TaxID=56956 RepID=UPI003B830D11
MTKRFLTVGKVARELGVSPATVRKLCEEGVFQGARRIGRWWRIPLEAVQQVKDQGAPLRKEAK